MINKNDTQALKDALNELKYILGEGATVNEENIQSVAKSMENMKDLEETLKYFQEEIEKSKDNLERKNALTQEQIRVERQLLNERQNFKRTTGKDYGQVKQNAQDNGALDVLEKIPGKIGKAAALLKMANKAAQKVAKRITDICNLVSQGITVAFDNAVLGMQKEANTWMAYQEIAIKTSETNSKIFLRQAKQFSKMQSGVLSSVFTSITEGVQQGAYAAARSSIDMGVTAVTNMYDTQMDQLRLANYSKLRMQKMELDNLKLSNQQISNTVGLISNIVNVAGGMFGPIGQAVAGGITGISQAIWEGHKKMEEAQETIEYQKAEARVKLLEQNAQALADAKKAAVEAAGEAVNKVLDFSNAIETLSKKTDTAAKSIANMIGIYSGNAEKFTDFIYNAATKLNFKSGGETIYLNKNAEDMQKAQSSYLEASGRNQVMGQEDYVKTFQLGTVLGDDQLAATLLGDMDYFNKSIADGTDLIFEMFQKANKAGVSNRKFAKDLQNNLKLAQKYTFKGGVKGMMEMSLWAQKTRFNMETLGSIVDKGLNEGLEGVIKQSAKLQVLGGNAALLSNPLAMMYEYGNDPGAAAKRVNEMVKGFGAFNSKTGEVEFSMSDTLHLKNIAEAYGMDATELRNQATQAIKGKHIDKQLNRDYTEEQKALLYNKAQLDQKTGKWVVTMDDGSKKDINDIQGDEWAQLMPTEEAIENYVKNIYDLLSREEGATKYQQAVIANETKDNLRKNSEQRTEDNLRLVEDPNKLANIKNLVETANDFVTTHNKLVQDKFLATSAIIDEQFEIMNKSVRLATQDMQDAGSEMRLALNAVSTELSVKLGEASSASADLANAALAAAMGLAGLGDGDVLTGDQALYKSNWDEMSGSMKILANQGYQELKNVDLQNISRDEFDKKFYEKYFSYAGDHDLAEMLQESKIIEDDTIEEFYKNRVKIFEFLKQNEKNFGIQNNVSKETVKAADENTYLSQVGQGFAFQSQMGFKDGFAEGGGQSMITSATKVTPINDGSVQLAKSHPQDSALFAKAGGPFDTLFNKVFSKVDSIYGSLIGGKSNSTSSSPSSIQLNVNGEINLKSGNQTVDLLNIMKNNPTFLATMSQLIVTQLSKNVNGGKTSMFDWLRSV